MRWSACTKLVAPAALSVLLCGCGSSATTSATVARARVNRAATAAQSSAGFVTPVVTIQLAHPLALYTAYVEGLARRLPGQVRAIESAASRGDMPGAESAWVEAHMTYLEIGQDDASYGAFGDLGEQIDGLADGLPGTTASSSFTGFHRVELDLWRRHDAGAAATDSHRLLELVDQLTPATITHDLPIRSLAVDGWVLRCHEILEDALRDSLSQTDDYGSNTDLASLAADVSATREMLRVLAPLIEPRRPNIVPDGAADLDRIQQAISAAGGPDARQDLATLPLRRRQALSAAVGAATETLAPVSEILQVTAPGS
jgi:iron uptake system EfeUOB component EfeO/EfeM